jgi:hypothetical protein
VISAPANFTTANAALAKEPIYLITIAGYSRVFTNKVTGVSGQYDWIEDGGIDDLSITVNDLDGSADLGELRFTVQDKGNAITADFPTFTFEGKAVTLKTGFVGMAQVDFAILFTGKIDSVASTNSNNSYLFTCVDNKQALTKIIYTVGDDGQPTDSDHPRTINGHPLDILIAVLETEVGILSTDIGLTKIQKYRDTIYSGIQFVFTITSPPAAKDFIENELLKPLGAYLWVNNLGQFSVNFFYPTNFTPAMDLNPNNLKDQIPEAGQADLINQVSVRFDETTDGKFLGESIQEDGDSVAKYGLYGQQVIESAGLRSAFLGFVLSALVSRLIFLRYGFKPLIFESVTAIWSACVLEPGDPLTMTNPQVPDRLAGVMGITGKLFEVMDRTWNFSACTVTYKLITLDLATFKQYLITGNAEPNYTAASTLDQGKYMFLCNDSDQYSNGDPGNTLG